MSNDKDNPVTNISIMNDKIFIKEFSKEFYQKIIDIKDINTFEITLKKWIKNLDKNIKSILELMKNHNKNELLFSSIIGFFYQYGYCYYNGIGISVNYKEAFKWYLKSAKLENAMAKNSLGECYFYANDGCALGIYNLGVCYHYGLGTNKDKEEAILLFKKASDNGIQV
ncbi:TIR domain-containing protein [Rhizophagus irregularis DAOM 181602=DAOM 197198]|nr:TIR domain-containing protein [Rhizophagus irregularis DAOM 181602=DAOM 197198]